VRTNPHKGLFHSDVLMITQRKIVSIGWLVDNLSQLKISQKINFIFQNKEKYEHIREKGRKYVIDNFDWDIVRDNYTNLFKYIT